VFENLIESKPKPSKTIKETVTSVVVHIIIVFLAVRVTSGAAEQLQRVLEDTTLLFITPPEKTPPPPDAIVSANPPPQGFQTVLPPDEIPTEIPPVNLNDRFDPKDFTGKGVEGGIAAGVIGGTGPVTGETFLEAQLDDPPVMISQGPRRYPPVLEAAGITGVVTFTFVIDTMGHAEASSFKIIKSSHPAFAEPARDMILKSVFRPGKIKGQPVRVLVTQGVKFTKGE
jgi:outer membrane biosynthesis protein TonB